MLIALTVTTVLGLPANTFLDEEEMEEATSSPLMLQEDHPGKVVTPLGAEGDSQAEISMTHPQFYSLGSEAEAEAFSLTPRISRDLRMPEKAGLVGYAGVAL